jgi:mannosyl-oligosaccharide glucosidase
MPTSEEYHVDLYSWITKATVILSKIQKKFDITESTHPENYVNYTDIVMTMLDQMNNLHWSQEDHAYLDFGLYDAANTGVILESAVRCQNPESEKTVDVYVPIAFNQQSLPTESLCPADYPLLMYHHKGEDNKPMTRQRLFYKREEMTNQLIPHIGYNNLYPFLLTLVSPLSPQLSDILTMIQSSDVFWTEYGLRSISASDMFYWKENGPGDRPYWRGPIWINMNYLALKALNHYRHMSGPQQARCESIYQELRTNVIDLITTEYEKTGQFWEQYDDTKGAGMRGHPFTGWTSLLVNIMSEMY